MIVICQWLAPACTAVSAYTPFLRLPAVAAAQAGTGRRARPNDPRETVVRSVGRAGAVRLRQVVAGQWEFVIAILNMSLDGLIGDSFIWDVLCHPRTDHLIQLSPF